MVFHHLSKVHLKLNLSKCCFGVQNITFLSHVVSVEGFHLDPKKIVVVGNFPIPKTVTMLGPFWGLLVTIASLFLAMQKL